MGPGEVSMPDEPDAPRHTNPKICQTRKPGLCIPLPETRNQAAGIAETATTMSLIPAIKLKAGGNRPCEYSQRR